MGKVMKKYILTMTVIVVLTTPISSPNAREGWYVTGGAGGTLLQESSSTAADAFGNAITFDTDFDFGFGLQGAAGYAWDSHGDRGGGAVLRVEGEVFYKSNDIDTFTLKTVTVAGIGTFVTPATESGTGDVSALGFMANAWYEFFTGMPWRPYVGGGVGLANISLDEPTLADDDDWVFAYQFGAGLGYEITPDFVIAVEYRLLGTTDATFEIIPGVDFDSEYLSHNIGLVVRFFF